jgi:outer membrane biosynthesis protein TonB
VEKTKVTNSFGLNIYDLLYHEKLLISKAAVEELNQLLDPKTENGKGEAVEEQPKVEETKPKAKKAEKAETADEPKPKKAAKPKAEKAADEKPAPKKEAKPKAVKKEAGEDE